MSLIPGIIYKSTLMMGVIIVYVYGIYHWRIYKYHFVISSRMPILSYFIAVFLFMLLIISWLGDILLNFDITSHESHERLKFVKVAAGFSLCSLSAARSLSIYKRYQFMQSILNNEDQTVSADNIGIQFKMIIIYTIVGMICIPLTPIIGLWLPIIFFVSCFVMLVTLIIFMTRSKDGIGCTKETVILCIISFLCVASGPLPHQMLSYVAFALFFVYACLIWCVPIFYIRAMNRSKRILLRSRIKAPIVNMSPKSGSENMDGDHLSPSSVDNACAGENAQTVLDISTSYLHKPLYIYLKKKKHYILFREYLAHCFAVECLMFVQSVVTFCDLLAMECNGSLSESTHKSLHSEDRIMMQRIFDIKFDFLCGFWSEYKEYKTKMHSVSKASWEKQKKVYLQICLDIFRRFVATNAIYQINISAEVFLPLEDVFLNESTSDKFRDLNDFMYVFQEAVLEIYHLMNSVYAFNFKQFISKRMK